MPLLKVNFILIVLVNIAIVFLFVSYLKVRNEVVFESRRVDELEKRPLAGSFSPFISPDAGESARIIAPTTIPSVASIAPVIAPTILPTIKPTATPLVVNQKRITYIPLFGGSSQSTNTAWVDVVGSDFQLKASDYGTNSYFSWEAIAWVIGGSGEVKLRIYDTTNNVVVSGSDISGSSSKPSLISSGRLNFFSGNNTYRVQIASQTSSPAQFDFGRVKVVY